MKQQKTEYKILALDLEVRDIDEPAHITQCGAILYELQSQKELNILNTRKSGYVLPKRVRKDKSGHILKPAESITQEELYNKLLPLITDANLLLYHNASWDSEYILDLFVDFAGKEELELLNGLPIFCTMRDLAKGIGLIDTLGQAEKWPKLKEAIDHYLPGKEYMLHDGYEDAKATLDVFIAAFEKGDVQLGLAA
jgi:hypothetical protein